MLLALSALLNSKKLNNAKANATMFTIMGLLLTSTISLAVLHWAGVDTIALVRAVRCEAALEQMAPDAVPVETVSPPEAPVVAPVVDEKLEPVAPTPE